MELVVKTSLANLYSEPKFNSEMISQALLWEKVKILDNFDNWYKIKQWDNYESWVHEFYLTKINSRTLNNYYTVSERIQWVYSTPKKDSLILGEILFGTELPIKNREDNWLDLILPDNRTGFIEYIIQPNNFNLREKIIFVAKQFIGVPYLWGGKTSKGFDCSGFVQSIFKFCGISLERDTNQMVLNQKLNEIDFNKSNPGDLVFFHNNNIINHVAISLGNRDIIHSSGEVSIVPLFSDKSTKLSKSIYKTYSIDKLLDNE